uniref:Neurotransmitter-gated ion-channel transmembrane domain-containing protein n=1 Tax=Strigamia maritima TaxID=126957 RepID=T1JD84_STRMM
MTIYAIWAGHVSTSFESDKILYNQLDKENLIMPPEFKLKNVEIRQIQCQSFQEGNCKFKDSLFFYIFTFERRILQNILIIFLPSILIIILSWISFWLDVDLAAPRVALGQTSLLTLAAQFNHVQRNLPAVSTVKALDVWMFTCIFLAFGSLLEFAIAYNYSKSGFSGNRKHKVAPTRKMQNLDRQKSSGENLRSKTIDSWAKILFPFSWFTSIQLKHKKKQP